MLNKHFYSLLDSTRSSPLPDIVLPPELDPANMSFGVGQGPPDQGTDDQAEKGDDGQIGKNFYVV